MTPESEVGLYCTSLGKRYGGTHALKSVDLSLPPASVLGLIGENGAGKSTLNSIIAGMVRPDDGGVFLGGLPYAPLSPSEALQQGVALIHQEIRLLPELTVAENIFPGRLPVSLGRIDRSRMVRESRAVLDNLGIGVDPQRRVAGLSMVVQQGIEIAKAIIRKPRYVIFDEPTASLGEAEAERILEQVRVLRASDTGIIYVSHHLDEVRTIADRVICLRDGALVASWDRSGVNQQDMINAMVGREFTFEHWAPTPRGHRTVLKLDAVSRAGAFQDISFELAEGELLGFTGLIGAGGTEVVRAIAGMDRFDSGEIRVGDKPVRYASPSGAMRAGIFMVPEDRKSEGLNLGRTAAENITLPWEKKLVRSGMITKSIVSETGDKQKQRFDKGGASISGQLDVGRQSAESASCQVAGGGSERLYHRRIHARRRCRRQDGDLRDHPVTRGERHRRHRGVVRTGRSSGSVASCSRHVQGAATRNIVPEGSDSDAGHVACREHVKNCPELPLHPVRCVPCQI